MLNNENVPRLVWLRITDIKIPEIRLNSEFSQEEYAEFIDSLGKNGQLQSVVVVEDESGEKWLVDGRHRLEALKALGHKIVRAEIKKGKLADAITGSVIHNLRRGRVNVAELSKVIQFLHQNFNWTLDQIAQHLGYKSKGIVSRLLKVADSPELLKMAEEGKLTLHDIFHLDEVLHAKPISEEKASFAERGEILGVQKSEQESEVQPLTFQDLGVTSNLKEAMESGKRFVPLGSDEEEEEKREEEGKRSQYKQCLICGKHRFWKQTKSVSLCYPEHLDLLSELISFAIDKGILSYDGKRWNLKFV